MSPRSEEFMVQARDRLAAARELLEANHLAVAVSSAYYSMLYGARAALSEEDQNAKTHAGTWHLFHERFVAAGAFDQHMHALAGRAQDARIQGDYEAVAPSAEEATEHVEGAGRFLAAIDEMLAN